ELEGHNDPDLLAAALLHDVGKSVHSPSVLDRIVVVLANQIIPRRVLRWGVSDVRGWRRPFAIAAQHARWGAELTVEHGASSTLVDLIRNHQDPASEDTRLLLKHLQRVDSQN
ncbi:MAG: HD domain-containing protein, partial [Anaerolineales bacterium]